MGGGSVRRASAYSSYVGLSFPSLKALFSSSFSALSACASLHARQACLCAGAILRACTKAPPLSRSGLPGNGGDLRTEHGDGQNGAGRTVCLWVMTKYRAKYSALVILKQWQVGQTLGHSPCRKPLSENPASQNRLLSFSHVHVYPAVPEHFCDPVRGLSGNCDMPP